MTEFKLDPIAFLKAGGRLSLDEWVALDDAERKAFAAAGDVILDELAARILHGIGEAVEDGALLATMEGVEG